MSDSFNTINPASEAVIETYKFHSKAYIDETINSCHATWSNWKSTAISERKNKMLQLASNMRADKQALGELITNEMGKPIAQAIAEVEKCAWVCEYYAENAEGFLKSEIIESAASKSYVTYEPLGIILAIMPWNFPFWQVFRFAAPNLMAGNAALLKHAPNTTGCGLAIERLFIEAGFPKSLFNTLIVDIPNVEGIVANPKVTGVTLTGSTRAGKSVAALAGKYLKKSVLELGGSDPYVILDDADLDAASETCVAGRILNTGQSCIAAKRFIVTSKNKDAFTRKVQDRLNALTYDAPLKNPDLGAMAREDLREGLHKQVEESIKMGAKCVLGGKIPEGKGFYYPPTLLTEVSSGMPAYDQELFGPVAVIIEAKDENVAINIANDTNYGLGAAVFSRDIQKAEKIAARYLQAGCCFINESVKSDPRLPFGGIKESGYGRELSKIGIYEFLNAKTVFIK